MSSITISYLNCSGTKMKDIILHTPRNLSFSGQIVKHLPQTVRRQLPVKIAVVPVSVKKSASLNRRYRKKHKPANVLSFLYGPEYGEIIVCPSVVRHEARMQGHTYRYQMTWMVVHGTIHLSGLHHERSRAAAESVEELEQKILRIVFKKKVSS